MRVQPRPLITLGLAVVYMAIVGIVWAIVGLNYDEVGDSTSTVVKGIVIPIVLGGDLPGRRHELPRLVGPGHHTRRCAPPSGCGRCRC